MPTVIGSDDFNHGDFTVPGGGPYNYVSGTPTKDTTIVRPGDPASLLINAGTDHLGYQYASPPALAWRGYAFRVNTGEEDTGNMLLTQMWIPGFAEAAKLYWNISSNFVQHTIADITFQSSVTLALDDWHWFEHIFDVGTTTHAIYTRVNGVDMTAVTRGGQSVTTVEYVEFGRSLTYRFSHHLWGTAASITDWLGEPVAGRTYKRFFGPALLTSSAADLYTVPSGRRSRVLGIHASNPTASPVDLTLSIGTDAVATRVYDDFEVAADSVETSFDPYDMASGEKIQGLAGTTGVMNLTITGYEEDE